MIKQVSLYTIAILGFVIFFSSCKKEYESIETIDDQAILTYISKNNIVAEKDPSGFYYQIIDEGSGAPVANTDSVFYSYDFKHVDGTTVVKNSDYNIPGTYLGYAEKFSFKNIPAFRTILSKLKRGGSAKIILPSGMAFGKNGLPALGVASNEIIVINMTLYPFANQVEADDFLINKFITANNLQTTQDPSRVYYLISAEGTDKENLKTTSTVTVKYTGRLLDGTVFQSDAEGTSFNLNGEVIAGWEKVIPGKIGKGGKIRLLIPSDLAYSKGGIKDSGTGAVIIPGNACLDFELEVVDFKN